ncbi:MAG: carboxypeptidase regulatory-like domain-containing protein [Flavobacteriales bacterium]
MMIKQFTCTALALMFVVCTMAQATGEIHGKVTNEDNQPMEFVVMLATNGADMMDAETDKDGRFKLKPLKPGSYTVQAYFIGFDTLRINNVAVEADRITFLNDIKMVSLGLATDSVIIYTYTKPLLYGAGEQMETLTAADLEHNAAAQGGSLVAMVAALSSDVKPSPNGEELYFRGSRSGGVIFFIDGMKVPFANINIPASGIQTISMYTGGVPAKYGDTTGGVIVVETKSYLADYYKKLNAMTN